MTTNELTDADREALTRALKMTLAEPDRAAQVERMLLERGSLSAGKFASFHQQVRHLQLEPWASPPCWIGSDAVIDPEIMKIGNRLERAGLSLFEPDPLKALAAKQRG